MMRLVALLGAVSLLVCQSAGQDAANAEEQEDFNDLYPADRTHGLENMKGLQLDDDVQHLHSATKRDVSDRQREIDMAAKQRFYPYGRRTDAGGQAGYIFGKRGQYFIPNQYQKRELDEVNPYSVAKRDDELTGLEEYEAIKRADTPYGMSGLRSLSFGKRDMAGPDLFGSYAFGKRALGSNFAFGKRGYGLSSFDFGKRAGLGSSFAFGKRGIPEVDRYDDADALVQDKRALGNSFSFGKRSGLSSFTFGKRAGER